MPGDPQPWHTWFDVATIGRSVAYASDGDVERVRREGDDIFATVQGHQTYRVHIVTKDLQCDEEHGILAGELETSCTCPVAWHCKHAAAALIALARSLGIPDGLDEDGDKPSAEALAQAAPVRPGVPMPSLPVAKAQRDDVTMQFGSWLRSVGQRDVTWSGEHRLCWHLMPPRPGQELRWRAVPVLARRLKSGAWGVGKRFTDIGRVVEQIGSSVPHADGLLLRRVAALRHPHHVWEEGWLDAACGAGGELIEALIASGVCYLESFAHGPLRVGPTMQVELAWRGGDDGWRLELQLPRGRMIPTWPPWWIDGDEAGPLESGLDNAAFDAVRTMPLVPIALLPTALPVLARLVPGLPDAPVAPTAVPPSGYLLRCRVRFAPQNGYLHAGFDAESLAVWMRYGEVLVDADGTAAARAPDGSLVVRDLPAERSLINQLAGFGLVTDQDLKLARGAGAPRAAVPLLVHRASLEAAQRSGQQRIGLPTAVVVAARAAGWTVEGDDSAVAPDLAAETVEVAIGEPNGIDWFELHLGISLGGERIDVTPVIARLVAGGPGAQAELPRIELAGRTWLLMALPDGRLVRLPEAEVVRLATRIEAMFDAQPAAGRGWKVEPALALQLDELAGGRGLVGERLTRAVDALRRLSSPEDAAPPAGLTASLRSYQRIGLGWMQRLREAGMGGVLADDMGLGKTVQTIAFLCDEHAAGRLDHPALVVCPASVVGTWRHELARFAPGLHVGLLHGSDRPRDSAALAGYHVLITTYGTLVRDQDLLESCDLHLVICDEAQTIKNATAKAGVAVRRLRARHRLALSGTPLENHLGELHTLMHWLVPGLLGDRARFDRTFRKPIEQSGDLERARLLRQRIAPFVLRRTKAQVAPELPPRTEVLVPLDLTATQRELYESVRLSMDKRVREALADKGLARSRIDILDALLKLRQVCCDPRLVRGGAVKVAASAKLDWLSETLPELVEDGRRILLFSQFTSLLDLVEQDVLKPAHLEWLRLDGATRDRQDLVERFQAGEVPVFLLSLKAGGTGLTLTAADTVILLDPWWNPAAEAQAADRAHRIGQDKPVFIYRPVCSGTVEERIQALQARKRGLADALWDGSGQVGGELSEDDLDALLAPLPD
jgi:superfamily II DNA or RNA helicase